MPASQNLAVFDESSAFDYIPYAGDENGSFFVTI